MTVTAAITLRGQTVTAPIEFVPTGAITRQRVFLARSGTKDSRTYVVAGFLKQANPWEQPDAIDSNGAHWTVHREVNNDRGRRVHIYAVTPPREDYPT